MTQGALLLDKPVGISSNRALQEAKKLYGAGKAGHAGTLDPLASGLLVVLFGEATKLAGALLDDDKEYVATLKLGERTSTGDAEGAVLERKERDVSGEQVKSVLARFVGEIEQVPPMHSALKRGGVPLYLLARKGETVERAPRRVRIFSIETLGLNGARLELRVRCSKGTYIRSLAEDIGAALGTCAHLAALRRTRSGELRVEDASALEDLAAMPAAARTRRLLGMAHLLRGLPRVQLDGEQEARFRNGQTLKAFPGEGLCAVYGADGAVLGLAQADAGALRPLRLLASSQAADKHRKTL
jgi:tRNA pseudouridine55 synthase